MNDANGLNENEQLVQQTQIAAASLRKILTVADTKNRKTSTTYISVPEREELIELISQILPAGNVVGFVLNGIMNVKDRGIPPAEGRIHFNSLFKGLAIVRNNAFYRMMFAGPATVLAGYNMLLRLAGAKPEDFLPDGVWQFYVEFGLREDAARHHNETLGFQQAMKSFRPPPSEAQQLTSWVLAAMWLLRDYDHLLANVWEEHVRLAAIEETTGLSGLHRAWQSLRPFGVPFDQITISLPLYRRQRFEAFCEERLSQVGKDQRQGFEKLWNSPEKLVQRKQAAQAYQKQLSIQTILEPGEYGERRVPIHNTDLSVGIIHEGNYYLLRLVDPTTPTGPSFVYAQVENILQKPRSHALSGADHILVTSPRLAQPSLRRHLGSTQQQALQELQKAPILINWDATNGDQPLSVIRQGQRGFGDHSLTFFRTHKSMVFDFSHIYFDGPWAMEVAEMLTNEAIKQLHQNAIPHNNLTPQTVNSLDLRSSPRLEKHHKKSPPAINYISGESSTSLVPVSEFRKLLLTRTKPTVHMTVNDLLVLFRTLFNQCYQASPQLERALADFHKKGDKALSQAVSDMLTSLKDTNPSLLIPIDAGQINPKDRIFPSTFRSPFPDFYRRHSEVLNLMRNANRSIFKREETQRLFNDGRQEYLSTLLAFGEIMRRYREIAIGGESMSTTAIRLIAGLPGAMQRLADGLPGHFSFINEAIKGEEVFSNVGQVTPGSSISRFASAKDDNDKKVLVWGVMSDNNNNLYITLRDFRPAIIALAQAGHVSLGQMITQDFVDAFSRDFQQFIVEARSIVSAPKASKLV